MIKRLLIPLAVLAMAPLAAPPAHAADKEEAAAGGATLDQFNFGSSVANGEISKESVKGKAVVLEFWGVH